MDAKIYTDPGELKARPWFGLETRTVITIGVGAIVLLPVIYAAWKYNISSNIVGFVCVAIGAVVGTIGISKRHGLHAEEWIPLAMADMRSPLELSWHAPVVALYSPQQSVTRAQKRHAKQMGKAAKKSRQAELALDTEFALELIEDIEEGGEEL